MTHGGDEGKSVSLAKTPSPAMPVRLKKNPKDQSILNALLPGSHLDKNTKKIVVHAATSNETIRFNVGGTYFETYRSTLRAIPSSSLANDAFLMKHYRPKPNDYFFDRDPKVFHCILNYLRSGELHLPASVCGPVVKSELEYWGIEEMEIEECCWSRYANWVMTLQGLRKLEADRTENVLQWQTQQYSNTTCCGNVNKHAWNFFSDPGSSLASAIYSYVSMTVIFISIFCFCAQTHQDFQIQSSDVKGNVSTTTDARYSSDTSNQTKSDGLSQEKANEWTPHPILCTLDFTCFIFLLVELITKCIVCPKKLRFVTQPLTILECIALLPDICALVLRLALLEYSHEILDLLRIFRVFRLFRLMRQIPGLWILLFTLKASIKDLVLLVLFLFLGILFFSPLVYFAEKDQDGTKFTDIPICFWWTVITMTTVGYGDMSPETKFGYLIGALTAVSGLLMIGFTVPILVNNFVLYYHHTKSTIDREKQRARVAKQTLAKQALVEKEKKKQNRSTSNGLLNFNSFKKLAFESVNHKISTNGKELNGRDGTFKEYREERDGSLDNEDLKIVIDNPNRDVSESTGNRTNDVSTL